MSRRRLPSLLDCDICMCPKAENQRYEVVTLATFVFEKKSKLQRVNTPNARLKSKRKCLKGNTKAI